MTNANDMKNYHYMLSGQETRFELVHKVADSINPESQLNPNYWKSEHEQAMETMKKSKNAQMLTNKPRFL